VLDSDENLPFNVGNLEEITILELARTLITATGSRSEIVFGDRPEDDPERRRADISRARELLGWEPRISLAAGLELTLPYFRNLAA